MITIIGDVHGKLKEYEEITKLNSRTIQLGDFGFKTHHDWHLANIDSENHKILFGNHDYLPYLNKKHSLSNWTYLEEESILCIRGADSIDKQMRTQGLDWFENEELSYREFNILLDTNIRPKIILSHDAPDIARLKIFRIMNKSLTSSGLQQCLELWRPEMWIFGHHHRSVNEYINNTLFVGLKELETFLLDI